MTGERLVRVGVASDPGLTPGLARRVAREHGGWERAAEAGARGDLPVQGGRRRKRGRDVGQIFATAASVGERVLELSSRAGVRVLLRGEADWPVSLECLTDPPEALFVRGRLALAHDPGLGVVGARECSAAGRALTARIARRLAEEGVCIVSGCARGIDAAAHEGALSGAGDTIAVLGAGVDRPYPAENRALHERIGLEGLLVSEFAPGVEPAPWHFPRRNRILAALSRAVLVVECRLRSGALVTARHALEQGKEIYAVPGWPDSPFSDGPLALLRDGARPVRHAVDVLEDLGGIPGGPGASAEERDVARAVEEGAWAPETLARRLEVPLGEARERLARAELLGLVGPPRSRSQS